jgi:hypothetical protein
MDQSSDTQLLELEEIPELDLTGLWEQVMRVQTLVDLGDQELTSGDSKSGTHSARSSQVSLENLEFEKTTSDELADTNGVEYNAATYGLTLQSFVCQQLLVKVAELGEFSFLFHRIYLILSSALRTIGPNDLEAVCNFNFFVRQKTAVRTHEEMQKIYCRANTKTPIPSLKSIRTRMLALSALSPVEYHCCKNLCVCYAGYLADFVECPYCYTPRLSPSGRPYAIF